MSGPIPDSAQGVSAPAIGGKQKTRHQRKHTLSEADAPAADTLDGTIMSRRASLWVLAGTALVAGAFFFHVIREFLMPLFLAVVLAMLFYPMYETAVRYCRGWRRVAAVGTIIGILVIVFVPLGTTLFFAGQEMLTLAKKLLPDEAQAETNGLLREQIRQLKQGLTDSEFSQLRQGLLAGGQPTEVLPAPGNPTVTQSLAGLEHNFSPAVLREEMQSRSFEKSNSESLAEMVDPENGTWLEATKTKLRPYVPAAAFDRLDTMARSTVSRVFSNISAKTQSFISNTVAVVVGFVVMLVALYFFFVDGPKIVSKLETLLPLEGDDRRVLIRQFDDICRGVVLGTVVAAVVQAALLGVGLAVAGIERVWLLTGLTMICAMIPLIGSAGVYVPVAIFLLTQDRYLAGALLLAYGGGIVSTSDNIVRAYVLHERARLHPLVAFISMLGGLNAIGLWGLFLGPIVAGFFYSLLKILHQRLEGNEIVAANGDAIGTDDTSSARDSDQQQEIVLAR